LAKTLRAAKPRTMNWKIAIQAFNSSFRLISNLKIDFRDKKEDALLFL